jgi:hypothetical protein
MGVADTQNFSVPSIAKLLNGATCAFHDCTSVLAVGLAGKSSSVSSALLAVMTSKPAGGATFAKPVPSGMVYLNAVEPCGSTLLETEVSKVPEH